MARLSTPRPLCFLLGVGGRGKAEDQKEKERWGGVFLRISGLKRGRLVVGWSTWPSPGSWLQLSVDDRKDTLFFLMEGCLSSEGR